MMELTSDEDGHCNVQNHSESNPNTNLTISLTNNVTLSLSVD